MNELKRTPLRHKLLAEIGRGGMRVYCGLRRNFDRPEGGFLKGQEKAQAEYLWPYVEYRRSLYESRSAKLNDRGNALLAAWNEKHGEVSL